MNKTTWNILYWIVWILFIIAIYPLPLGHYLFALACGLGILILGMEKTFDDA